MVEDFFPPQENEESINGSDYENTGLIIEAARAFGHSTYQCVYIIDCVKKKILHVSDNIADFCGSNADKIKNLGYKFYIDYEVV